MAADGPLRLKHRLPRNRRNPAVRRSVGRRNAFSMYSDMSMRINAASSSNRNSASALQSSVLPTPVGPRNMKLPIGRALSCSPARERRTALATAARASSWPTTRVRSRSSICSSFSRSPASILSTGIPGPARDHRGDVLLGDGFAQHASFAAALSAGQVSLQFGYDSIGKLAGSGEIPPGAARSPARSALGRAQP